MTTPAFAPKRSPYLQDAEFEALRAAYDEAKKLGAKAAGIEPLDWWIWMVQPDNGPNSDVGEWEPAEHVDWDDCHYFMSSTREAALSWKLIIERVEQTKPNYSSDPFVKPGKLRLARLVWDD